jgi:hypothetical protein
MIAINYAVQRHSFTGWGMSTRHALPWADDPDWAHFRDAADHVREKFEHGLSGDTGVVPSTVDQLLWRHWIVAFAARHACIFADGPVTMVECGVGDGLTSYFACNEAEHLGRAYQLHAYDTWSRVETDRPEQSYADLEFERTQRNLGGFPVIYHPGLIPDSLRDRPPDMVHYLSIDLNAAAPTVDALEFFAPRLARRPVILFDDYGHVGYEDTRKAVDAYFAGKPGSLMKVPTGQAIWFG